MEQQADLQCVLTAILVSPRGNGALPAIASMSRGRNFKLIVDEVAEVGMYNLVWQCQLKNRSCSRWWNFLHHKKKISG